MTAVIYSEPCLHESIRLSTGSRPFNSAAKCLATSYSSRFKMHLAWACKMRLIQFRAMLNQPNSTGDTAAGRLAAAACAGLECPTKQLFKGHVFAASMPARALPEDSLLKNASCKFITDLRTNGDLYHQALGAAVVTRSRRASPSLFFFFCRTCTLRN